MDLMDALEGVGYVVDTPRALTHGLVAKLGDALRGKPIRDNWRASGREMLESLGVLGPNQDGLDAGDVLGFGAEMALDPLNLLGGAGVLRKVLGNKKALTANRAMDAAERSSQLNNLAVDAAQRARLDHADHLRNVAGWSRQHGPPKMNVGPEFRKLDGDLGYYKLEMPEGRIDKVIDVSRFPEKWKNAFDVPHLTDQDRLDIAYGARDLAAEKLAKWQQLSGFGEAPEIARKMAEGGEFTPYGFNAKQVGIGGGLESEMGGFLAPIRPDITFVSRDYPLPTTGEIAAHESLHSLARKYPDDFDGIANELGVESMGRSIDERFGYVPKSKRNLEEALWSIKHGPATNVEEHVANMLGKSTRHGMASQRFPLVDMMFTGKPSDFKEEFASLIKQRYPQAKDPQAVASRFIDFLSGDAKKRRALVPVRDVSPPELAPKSFSTAIPPPSGIGRYTDPYAGERIPVERLSPMLASLLGYNVARNMDQ